MNEHVVLVDENNQPIGVEDKYKVHTKDTPLHRGFSLFLFNSSGELLLQQRAATKKTWPGVWSNSVCGHPANGETDQQAAARRAKFELGIELAPSQIYVVLQDYHYRYEHQRVVENEFCPVMLAFGDFIVKPNPDEVKNTRWIGWGSFLDEISAPNKYSEWCQEEARLLSDNKLFLDLYRNNTKQ